MTRLTRARIAVSVLFVVNSLGFSAWLSRLPEIQQSIGLGDGQLGVVLAVGSAGGLVVGPLSGILIARSNSTVVAVAAFVATVPALLLIGFVGSGWALAAALFWFGAADAVMDGAMNSHAFRLQDVHGRSIINGFHGYWSLATVAGALIGSVTLVAGIGVAAMLGGIVLLSALVVGLTSRWLLRGPDPLARDADELAVEAAAGLMEPAVTQTAPAPARLLGPAIRALGIFTLMAVLVEDLPSRWSSVYLSDIGAPLSMIGLGLAAFSAAMTIGRFAGDSVVKRWGEARVVRVGMLVSPVAFAGALLIAQPLSYIAACFVGGLCIATAFPAAMHAATHVAGVRPAMGVAMVGWFARVAYVVGPLVVGLVAEAHGVGWGMVVPIVASLVMAGMAGILRPVPKADESPRRPDSDGTDGPAIGSATRPSG